MPVFADALPMPEIEFDTIIYDPGLENFSTILWIFMLIIVLALFAYWIICLRKIFNKAWLHWRGSLIPVYREYLRFKMVWWNGRWTASLLCPFMFFFILILSYFKTSEKFWKDKEQFGLWLLFLHPIFLWILAFDKSKYQK